jgi:hypothetical protein
LTSLPVLTTCDESTNRTSPASSAANSSTRNALHLVLDQTRQSVDPVPEKRARIRLDARDVDPAVEPASVDVCNEQRRVARAHFDHPARTPRVQQHEERARIEPAELAIARVEIDEARSVGEQLRIVVELYVSREDFGENPPMSVVVPVDAGDDRLLRPQPMAFGAKLVGIDQRRVEMPERDERRTRPSRGFANRSQQPAKRHRSPGMSARAAEFRERWLERGLLRARRRYCFG